MHDIEPGLRFTLDDRPVSCGGKIVVRVFRHFVDPRQSGLDPIDLRRREPQRGAAGADFRPRAILVLQRLIRF
jgi:hypothetical protein